MFEIIHDIIVKNSINRKNLRLTFDRFYAVFWLKIII